MRRRVFVLVMAIPALLYGWPPEIEWSRTYGGANEQGAYHVLQTADGGFLAAGYDYVDYYQTYDFLLLRTTASGDTLWSRRFGCTLYDFVESIARTADGGFVVLGSTDRCGGIEGAWLLRISVDGDSLWSRFFLNYGLRMSIAETTDGGLIFAYSTYGFGPSLALRLVRTDATGDTLWTRVFDNPNDDVCLHLRQNIDGGFSILALGNMDWFANWQLWILRTDVQGNLVQDTLRSMPPEFHRVDAARFSPDGNVILAILRGPLIGPHDAMLVKVTPDADTLWCRPYFSQAGDRGLLSVEALADGGFLLNGLSQIVRTDSLGYVLWELGSGADVELSSTAQTTDGGFILAGVAYESPTETDLWLMKLGPELAANPLPYPLPADFGLRIHPNPFNGTTNLAFELTLAAHARLAVYDVNGRLAQILAESWYESGTHSVVFDGGPRASGIYFVRLEAAGHVQIRKLALLK